MKTIVWYFGFQQHLLYKVNIFSQFDWCKFRWLEKLNWFKYNTFFLVLKTKHNNNNNKGFHRQWIQNYAYLHSNGIFLYLSDNSDISVTCGTNQMFLRILLCPMYFGGYNESLMALNARFGIPDCRGVADWSSSPPVLMFNFSISQEALLLCGNTINVRTFLHYNNQPLNI